MKCEPVVFSLGEERWSCKTLISWLFEYTDTGVLFRGIVKSHLCGCRDMQELHRKCPVAWICKESSWGTMGRDYWWRASRQCNALLLPGLQFLFDTCSAALHISGVFCFSDGAGKQFVTSECNRAIAFLLLSKKVRSCWVLHPFSWESRFSEMAAEECLCLNRPLLCYEICCSAQWQAD